MGQRYDPERTWEAIAYDDAGSVLGVARNMTEDDAKQQADRWWGLVPGVAPLPGAVRAEAVPAYVSGPGARYGRG